MLIDKELKIGLLIKASPDKVWNVLTEPSIIKQYLFGTNVVSDWKEGSDLIFEGEYNKVRYRDKGKIASIVKDKNLEYTYLSSFSGSSR